MKITAPLSLASGVCVVAVSLWAADSWQAKLFTDWNDKEVQRISENSPWAKQFSIALGGGGAGGGKSGKGGKGGGGSGGGSTLADDTQGLDGGGGPSVTFTIRWQSALPIKQALVKMKYKAEAGTSAEAKQLLSATEPEYVVVAAGLNRSMVRGDAEQIKQALMGATQLVVKGKEPIKPDNFRLVGQSRMDAVFAFPKTNAITEDDKDVEFQCMVGTFSLRQKFHLKDMVFNGKLEL